MLEPTAALALLTVITATGSLGSYLLSRPLAPLIAVLFPKPLALVQVALAPESIPSPPTASQQPNEHMTPVQLSSNPADPPIGASTSGQQAVWRRLLVMRAMGIVPWSGMNVACGVVGGQLAYILVNDCCWVCILVLRYRLGREYPLETRSPEKRRWIRR